MISILTVNYNCLDWLKLQVASIRKFTTVPYEIVVVDNASVDGSPEWMSEEHGIKPVLLETNIGHGPGLDTALRHAVYPCCLILDIDAHVQRLHWDLDLIDYLHKFPNCKLIAAKGGEAKPVHPCFMFFIKSFFLKHNLSFKATKDFDVGRKIYHDVTELEFDTFRVPVGYESGRKKFYDGAYGDEYYLHGQPTVYHNWYSARMWGNEKVDSMTRDEYERRKSIVFNHPFVKEILETL